MVTPMHLTVQEERWLMLTILTTIKVGRLIDSKYKEKKIVNNNNTNNRNNNIYNFLDSISFDDQSLVRLLKN